VIDYTDRWVKAERSKCKGPCTPYPISMALRVVEFFGAKRWLDPTAGWGDRLVAALWSAPGLQTYVGVDSNRALQPAYDAIIEAHPLGAYKMEHVSVHTGRLQDVLPKLRRKFDLVFTSPPFFRVDEYEDMEKWASVDEYLSKFLKPLVRLSAARLSPGGHLVLYIEDRPDAPYLDQLKEEAQKARLHYEGVLWYQGAAKFRPHYVWSA
jgi:tRNA1(Val) A37 N6-methylase TrmN6